METKEHRPPAHIGDVLVCPPGTTSPYGCSINGRERAEALRKFRDREPIEFELWIAPTSGGARRIADPAQVRWLGLRSNRDCRPGVEPDVPPTAGVWFCVEHGWYNRRDERCGGRIMGLHR